jgi:hypothetical protein
LFPCAFLTAPLVAAWSSRDWRVRGKYEYILYSRYCQYCQCCESGYARIRNFLQDPELKVVDPDLELGLTLIKNHQQKFAF